MLLRNDTDVPLHIPPSDTGPGVLVQPGDEIEYPTHVAGLTPLDHEFVDGEWRPAGAAEPTDDGDQADTVDPAKTPKTSGKPKQAGGGDNSEGVTP